MQILDLIHWCLFANVNAKMVLKLAFKLGARVSDNGENKLGYMDSGVGMLRVC